MVFKKFTDFLEAKKELMDVKDGLAGKDYDGPLSVKPPQEPTKGKSDKPLPYKAGGEIAKGVAWTADKQEKGLGWEATPGMTPETSPLGKKVEDKSKQIPKSKKKLTTEEFIATTKDMSNKEFANYILEQSDTALTTVSDLFGNEFTPDPTQTIQYVTGLMLGNPLYMERFVRELKRRGGMNNLVAELLEHNDSYKSLAENFEESEYGIDRCSKFARTLNDHYMSLYDKFDFGDEDLDESVAPNLDTMIGKPKGSEFGNGGFDNTPDPNYTTGSQYATNPTANPMGAQDMRNPTGSPAGGAANPQFPSTAGMQPPVMPPKKMKEGGEMPFKFKGNSAGHQLISEMSGYPHFKKYMIEKCVDC